MNEEELLRGGRRRKVSEVRAKIACHLTREMGLSLAEIARNLGVGTSAIAKAIRKVKRQEKSDDIERRPPPPSPGNEIPSLSPVETIPRALSAPEDAESREGKQEGKQGK